MHCFLDSREITSVNSSATPGSHQGITVMLLWCHPVGFLTYCVKKKIKRPSMYSVMYVCMGSRINCDISEASRSMGGWWSTYRRGVVHCQDEWTTAGRGSAPRRLPPTMWCCSEESASRWFPWMHLQHHYATQVCPFFHLFSYTINKGKSQWDDVTTTSWWPRVDCQVSTNNSPQLLPSS